MVHEYKKNQDDLADFGSYRVQDITGGPTNNMVSFRLQSCLRTIIRIFDSEDQVALKRSILTTRFKSVPRTYRITERSKGCPFDKLNRTKSEAMLYLITGRM